MSLACDYTAQGGVLRPDARCWEWRDEQGRYHRVAGPAVIYSDGTRVWYQHGQVHRVGGPAAIWTDGTQYWRLHDQLHRADGPAIIYTNGHQRWYQHDQLHRADGPALIYPDGSSAWYVQGCEITAEVLAWMGANAITWPFNEAQQMEFALRWL